VSDLRPLGPLVPLNDLSRTARDISTQVGRKHSWVIEIQTCSNKGAGTVRGKIRTILINIQNFLLKNALIFGMEHPWGKEIQVCSNEVLRVMYMYGPAPGA